MNRIEREALSLSFKEKIEAAVVNEEWLNIETNDDATYEICPVAFDQTTSTLQGSTRGFLIGIAIDSVQGNHSWKSISLNELKTVKCFKPNLNETKLSDPTIAWVSIYRRCKRLYYCANRKTAEGGWNPVAPLVEVAANSSDSQFGSLTKKFLAASLEASGMSKQIGGIVSELPTVVGVPTWEEFTVGLDYCSVTLHLHTLILTPYRNLGDFFKPFRNSPQLLQWNETDDSIGNAIRESFNMIDSEKKAADTGGR